MKTSIERLNEILQDLGLNVKTLSEALGYNRPQGLYDVFNGRTKSISNDLANRITTVFPEYNRVWVLTGEGEKYITSGIPGTTINKSQLNNSPINGDDCIKALIQEVGEQRAMTQQCLSRIDKSQNQVDRLIDLLSSALDIHLNNKKQ